MGERISAERNARKPYQLPSQGSNHSVSDARQVWRNACLEDHEEAILSEGIRRSKMWSFRMALRCVPASMAQALRHRNAISRSRHILHLPKANAKMFSVQQIDAPPSKSMASPPTMKAAASKRVAKKMPAPKLLSTSIASVAPHPGGAPASLDPHHAHNIANAILVNKGRPPMPPYPPPAHLFAKHAKQQPKKTHQPKANAKAGSMKAPWCQMYGENHAT